MLPRNIDLTANRDFSNRSRNPIDIHIGQILNELPDIDSLCMTSDEYNALEWYEGIFGRNRHINEAYRVFDFEYKHTENWKRTCARCGKPIRVPWKNYGNVCEDCDCELEAHRVSWKKYYMSDGSPSHGDLFNLR